MFCQQQGVLAFAEKEQLADAPFARSQTTLCPPKNLMSFVILSYGVSNKGLEQECRIVRARTEETKSKE